MDSSLAIASKMIGDYIKLLCKRALFGNTGKGKMKSSTKGGLT